MDTIPLYPQKKRLTLQVTEQVINMTSLEKHSTCLNGITFQRGNYTEEEGTAQAFTTSTNDVTNNTIRKGKQVDSRIQLFQAEVVRGSGGLRGGGSGY